jgi:hypothetical protein
VMRQVGECKAFERRCRGASCFGIVYETLKLQCLCWHSGAGYSAFAERRRSCHFTKPQAKPYLRSVSCQIYVLPVAPGPIRSKTGRPDRRLRKRLVVDFDRGSLRSVQKRSLTRSGQRCNLIDAAAGYLQIAIRLERLDERVETIEPRIAPQLTAQTAGASACDQR